jgi:IS1 family transposase
MTTNRWIWTRHRKNLRSMMSDEYGCKRMTPEQLKQWLESLRRKAAAKDKWRPAELAATIVADNEEVDEIARRLGIDSKGVKIAAGGAA